MFSIKYNIIPILLIMLAGYMVYADKPYYGWVIVAALLTTVVPTSKKSNDDDEDDDE